MYRVDNEHIRSCVQYLYVASPLRSLRTRHVAVTRDSPIIEGLYQVNKICTGYSALTFGSGSFFRLSVHSLYIVSIISFALFLALLRISSMILVNLRKSVINFFLTTRSL
jgi:hypothetical protein